MISIIIPVYKEEYLLQKAIDKLNALVKTRNQVEIIIVNGEDKKITVEGADQIISSPKGRAIQMNSGAEIAKGEVLYFLHIDSIPPKHFDQYINQAISDKTDSGCFRMKFDMNHWLLNVSGWMTKFNGVVNRGGDQSLFIKKSVFNELNGFREDLIILEDIDMVQKIYKNYSFVVLNAFIVTSARRYRENGVIYLQSVFGIIHLMNALGFSQEKMLRFYKRRVR